VEILLHGYDAVVGTETEFDPNRSQQADPRKTFSLGLD
jgi:hypothetical protein